MEKLTTLANSQSQNTHRLQGLEIQLEKVTSQKESLEAKERKTKEETSLVSTEISFYKSSFWFIY